MTEQTPPKRRYLNEVISIRISTAQKRFIEVNNIAVGVWLRQMINKEMAKK